MRGTPKIGDSSGRSVAHSVDMWNRRKPATGAPRGRRHPSSPGGSAPAGAQDAASLLESYFPAAVQEHPAKRRIRKANELAYAMRQTGGRHRLQA